MGKRCHQERGRKQGGGQAGEHQAGSFSRSPPRGRITASDDGNGRRRYRIYGYSPGYEEQEGTDLTAVAAGYAAITPIHFDLTDHGGLGSVRELRLENALERVLESVST